MAYVGTPIDTRNTFQSLVGKRFSGNASTTAFTLDVAPSSTLDIEVFVENVRQDPNSAYSLSGTTLTFAAAPPSGTNNIYVVHQAKAVGTISPAAGTVNADSFDNTVISGHTALAATPADTDEFLVSDAGTLKRIDYSLIKGGGAFEHLLTTTASDSANVTFDSSYITTTYLDYMIVVSGFKPATDGVDFELFFSVDNGSNYLSDYKIVRHGRNSYGLDKNNASGSSGQIRLNSSSSVGGNTKEGISGVIKIFDPMKQSGTTDISTMAQAHMTIEANDSHLNNASVSGSNKVTTAVNNIKFSFGSGNIESGKISLYGRKVS